MTIHVFPSSRAKRQSPMVAAEKALNQMAEWLTEMSRKLAEQDARISQLEERLSKGRRRADAA
jgi:hypothetical protein